MNREIEEESHQEEGQHTDAEKGKNVKYIEDKKASGKVQLPSWIHQENTSLTEKIEIKIYHAIASFPLFVTFGLYTYLYIFFVGVILLSLNALVLRLPIN